jgi:hypothetical protein
MRGKLPGFGVLVLPLFVLTTGACNGTDVSFEATGPAPLSANVSINSSFGLEPSSLRSEIVPGSCDAQPKSGVRIGVMVRGSDDVVVQSLRFVYEDRAGRRRLPDVIPIPSLTSPLPGGLSIPTSYAIPPLGVAPLPPATTIPIPGAEPATGLVVQAGSQRQLNFLLHFFCVDVSEGQIIVMIESADRQGRFETSELRARVGP